MADNSIKDISSRLRSPSNSGIISASGLSTSGLSGGKEPSVFEQVMHAESQVMASSLTSMDQMINSLVSVATGIHFESQIAANTLKYIGRMMDSVMTVQLGIHSESQIMSNALTDISELLRNLIVVQTGIHAESQLLAHKFERDTLRKEEKEREDAFAREKQLTALEKIAEGVFNNNSIISQNQSGSSGGLFSGLRGIGAGIFGGLLASGPVTAVIRVFSKMFGIFKLPGFKHLGSVLSKVGRILPATLSLLGRWLGPVIARISMLGGLLAKIFFPIGVIIGSIKGAIRAFERFQATGSIQETISAFLAGFVDFFTFGLFDVDKIEGGISNAINFVYDEIIAPTLDFVQNDLVPFFNNKILPVLSNTWDFLYERVIKPLYDFVVDDVMPFMTNVYQNLIVPVFNRFVETGKKLREVFLKHFEMLWKLVGPIFKKIFEAASEFGRFMLDFSQKYLIPVAKNVIIPVTKFMFDTALNIINSVLDKVLAFYDFLDRTGIIDLIVATVETIVDLIVGGMKLIGKAISLAWRGLSNAMITFIGIIESVLNKVMPVLEQTPFVNQNDTESVMNALGKTKTMLIAMQPNTDENKSNNNKSNLRQTPKNLSSSVNAQAAGVGSGSGSVVVTAPQVVNNNTNVAGGGGNGGSIVVPTSTRQNETAFQRQQSANMNGSGVFA